MDPERIQLETRRWITDVVIGLNLCPFARRVFDGGLIGYTVTPVADAESLGSVLASEMCRLARTPATETETVFLIHPNVLGDFLDYNDFLTATTGMIFDLGLEGVIQLAGFHPRYQFAGSRPEHVENYTNRSPYPMIHLLREESITKVNESPADLAEIPRRNIETLRRIGLERMSQLLGGKEEGSP